MLLLRIATFTFLISISSVLGESENQTNEIDSESFYYPDDNGHVVKAYYNESGTEDELLRAASNVFFRHYLVGETQDEKISPDCSNCLTKFLKGVLTVFVAHGFNSNHLGGLGTNIRAGFAKRGDPVNMVFIDWSELAKAPWYGDAVINVKTVGKEAAKMIDYLVNQELVTLDDIHFIGHSLGAHVANYISKNLKSGKLSRVHALDPAYPQYENAGNSQKIDPSDGDFVMVIHTAGGSLWEGGLAFHEPRGHVDFYPNGGQSQPGCKGFDFGACKHARAHLYLAESIGKPDAFSACACSSWEKYQSKGCDCDSPENKVKMGWETPKGKAVDTHLIGTPIKVHQTFNPTSGFGWLVLQDSRKILFAD